MSKVKFKRKSTEEIKSLEIEDGSLIYDYETGATYLDYNDKRIPTGGGQATGDTLPIGTIVEYDGDTVPSGYEEIEDFDKYSTNEVKTNKIWIDGKPIYRKVVIFTENIPAKTWKAFSYSSFGLQDIDVLFIKEANIRFNNNTEESLFSHNYRIQNLISNNQLSFYFDYDSINAINQICFIFEYTKKTN